MQPDATDIHTGHAVIQQNQYLMYSILSHTGNQGIRFSSAKGNETTEPAIATEVEAKMGTKTRTQTSALLPANSFNDQ